MAKFKIELKREECIGCGSCEAVCPENWELKDDGKSMYKKAVISEKEYDCNKQAEEICPVKVIKIKKM